MKINLKGNNGIAGTDSLIAVLIIILFSGLIATFSYNIYISNSAIKRMSKAQGYIVDVFEHIENIDYDDVTEENIITVFNGKYYYEQDGQTKKDDAEVKMIEMAEDGEETENVDTSFKAEIKIEKYNETTGNTEKEDLVEQITMRITYKLGSKDQVIEMTRIKQKERNNLSV